MGTIGRWKVSLTGAAGKLNGQARSVHIGAIFIDATISGLLNLGDEAEDKHTESCKQRR